jgi:hypothetical protein
MLIVRQRKKVRIEIPAKISGDNFIGTVDTK